MRRGIPGRALTAVAMLAAGCTGTGDDAYAEVCGGPRPVFEVCEKGLLHADCGGEGSPVLACAERGIDCRWFTGGCVAEGFRSVDCSAADLCCIASADGTSAFEGGWLPDAPCAGFLLAQELAFVGRTPLGATAPTNLEVIVDPGVTSSSEEWVATVECAGIETEICRDGRAWVGRVVQRHDTFVVAFRPDKYGHALHVEVLPGGATGRVAAEFMTDSCSSGRASCDAAHPFPYELSGRLTVATVEGDPAEGDGILEVSDPAGGTMRITF